MNIYKIKFQTFKALDTVKSNVTGLQPLSTVLMYHVSTPAVGGDQP
jgi:hypothetical protein